MAAVLDEPVGQPVVFARLLGRRRRAHAEDLGTDAGALEGAVQVGGHETGAAYPFRRTVLERRKRRETTMRVHGGVAKVDLVAAEAAAAAGDRLDRARPLFPGQRGAGGQQSK